MFLLAPLSLECTEILEKLFFTEQESSCLLLRFTAQKMKFSIKDLNFSKYDQICSFLRIWSHLLNKSLLENNYPKEQFEGIMNPIFGFCCHPHSFFCLRNIKQSHDQVVYAIYLLSYFSLNFIPCLETEIPSCLLPCALTTSRKVDFGTLKCC